MDHTNPDLLRALAEGCDRLHDGDAQDIACADRVEQIMLVQHGLIRSNFAWYPKEQATSGYVWSRMSDESLFVRQDVEMKWWYGNGNPIPPGKILYWDADCTIAILKI